MTGASAKITDIYELSPIQQGMLFHSLLAPESGVYFEQVPLDFRGTLNSAALKHAWQKVVDRHSILRTSFYWEEVQKPLQVVTDRVTLPWVEEDFRGLSATELNQRREAFLAADRARGFELAKPPLMRMTLLRLGENDWQLVWSFHHILLDGWCASLLLQEVSRFYEAYQQDETVELPRPRPYRDYIGWLQQQDLKAAEGYWRTRLAGFTKPTVLGVGVARGEQHETGYGQSERYLTPTNTRALEALAREHQVTMNTVVQGAWAVLLSRYSGEQDVVYGVTVSGRPAELAGVDQMVGLFINTLPLRVEVETGAELGPWLRRLQAEQLEMRQYEYSPLVEVQGWSEVQRGVGLFETLLAYENYPIKQAASGQNGAEQEVKYDQLGSVERTNYPLTMLVGPGERLMLRAPYDKQRYSAETIERVLGHLEQIFVSMATGAQRVGDLRMLSAAEEQQIVTEWNETECEYPREACIHELFAAQAQQRPDAVAVIDAAGQISYGELNRRANQLAARLQELGVGPEVVVGICVERSVAMVIGLLGILKAGGAYLPLDAEYPRERLEYMVADAGASVLLTQEELRTRLPQQINAEVVYLDSEELWEGSSAEPSSTVSSANLAYLLYTSGSTGRPKAVAVTHRSAVALLSWSQSVFEAEALSGVLAATSINFDLSVFELFVPLSRGGTVIVVANALQLPELARREEVRLINTVPSAMRELVRSGSVPESVRVVNLAGEALSRGLVEEIYALPQVRELNNLYGPTEDTTYSTWERLDRDEAGAVRIGKPIANSQVYVLDEQQQVVPVGVRGELYLGGDGLARGYWGRAELTADRFVPDGVSGRSGARLYRTGDEVRYGADGRLEYFGRLDQQVKVRGYRIELGEVEEVLARHESIADAVVVVRDEQLVGYVVASEGVGIDVSELRGYLGEHLPGYMIPSVIVELPALPLTANGKVDRKALPEPGQIESDGEWVGPRTAVEEMVASVWSEVLGIERVGTADNFFELGGHSLLAMQVLSRVRESFKVELGLRSLFEAPTLSEFSSQIEQALGGEQTIAQEIARVDRDRELPLSFAQQRLWFLDQLEGTGSAYNIPGAIRLSGELNLVALERSLSEIVRRHEVLRTVFVAENGQPKQVILPEAPVKLAVIDLQQAGAEQESRVRDYALREAQTPFNLKIGPLMKLTVLQLAEREQVVLFTMHHIISDAWSMGVLVKEISSLYEAYCRGEESTLPELPVQYADYAVWQRECVQGDVLDQQLQYWTKQLDGVAPVLELPADRPRPGAQSFRGATEEVKLSGRLAQALKRLSASEDVTLYMTLLAGFQILLARYAGKEDIAVGSPIAGRNRKEVENLIGFFVNTLVLRTQVASNVTIQELLRRVRETALGAYSHQDIPFEQLIDALKIVREPGSNPLVQVIFTLQNAAQESVSSESLKALPVDVSSNTAKFDLTLSLLETNDGLVGGLQYSTDLFDEATIKRMLSHYERVLEEMVSNPQQRVGELQMLSAAEERQVVAEWNATAREYARDACIHEVFAEQARRRPDAVAVIADGEQVSYGELNARANGLAWRLQELGVGLEVVVGICVERSVELIVGLLGILKAGGAYLPLDADYPPERLEYMVADAGVNVVLTQSELRDRLPLSADVRCVELDSESLVSGNSIAPESGAPESGATAETLAYVIYTSGSTGQPKGVAVPHRGAVRLVQQSNYVKLDDEEVVLQMAPVSFDASTFEIWGPLLNGAKVVVMKAGQPSLEEIAATVRRHGVTTMWLTAGLFQVMATEQLASLREVKQLLAGGDVLGVHAVQAVLEGTGERFLINGYGPTENTTFSCCHVMRAGESVSASVPIGKPITNSTAYVLDEELRPVPVGVRGELYLGGDGLARGYVGSAELTAERFIPNPFSTEAGARLYRTGDVVRWNPEGVVEFIGRVDQQVKVRGFRIELGEVEKALAGYEGISESVVIVRTEGEGEKRLAGYIVAAGGVELEVSALREYLETKLPAYMIPSVFVELTELPLTANGKIDRKALAAAELEFEGKREYEAPQTAVEELLARLWAEVLGIERVGIHDNFFEIGGDSILGIQVISRANQVGVRLSPKDVYQHQTIAKLAAVAGTATEIIAEQGLVMGPVSLTPIQHWFFEQELNEAHHFNQSVLLEVKQRVDPQLLADAAQQLVLHHDALRMRYERSESGWTQYHVDAAEPVSFTKFDFSAAAANEQSAAIEAEAAAVQASLNVSEGPLVRFVYFDLGEGQPARLLVVCHHLVVDGVSWRILLEDLQRTCASLMAGEKVQLPAKTTSYQQWAEAVSEYAASADVQRQWDYWLAPVWDEVRALPRDYESGGNLIQNTCAVGVSLTRSETEALLQEVPGVYHTQINEVLLSALAVALGEWTGQTTVLVDMEGHGRAPISDQVEVSRTVGWFTTIYPVLLKVKGRLSEVAEVLKQVKEQVRSIPEQGLGYGMLRYLGAESESKSRLRALPQAEVVFNYTGQFDQTLSESGLFRAAREQRGEARSGANQRTHLLEVTGGVAGGQLQLTWSYSEEVHTRETVERVAADFIGALRQLIQQCQWGEGVGFTPSDFEDFQWSQHELDDITEVIRSL